MDTDYSKVLSQQTCIISLKVPMTASDYLEKHVRPQFIRYFQQKAEKQRGGTFENAAKCKECRGLRLWAPNLMAHHFLERCKRSKRARDAVCLKKHRFAAVWRAKKALLFSFGTPRIKRKSLKTVVFRQIWWS